MKTSYLILAVILAFLAIGGAVYFTTDNSTPTSPVDNTNSDNWRNVELTDVITGEKFKISDFKGKKVLIETFAVWCPTCLKQQQQLKTFKEKDLNSLEDDIVHISIDTDPNENQEIVREHVRENNFSWHFAVAPIKMGNSLIDEFGIEVINAPSAPIILVCKDQSARMLGGGVKSFEKLKTEIEKGC